MFQFSGFGISLTKPQGENTNVLLRAISLRPPVSTDGNAPPDAAALALGALDAAAEAPGATDAGVDGAVVPHAPTMSPTMAKPDSNRTVLRGLSRRDAVPFARPPLAPIRMLNDSSSYGDLDTVANALQSFPDRAGNLQCDGRRCQETYPEPWRNILSTGHVRVLRRGQPIMADTLVYIGRRVIQLFLVILVAGTVNFMIPRMIPGDPVDTALASLAARGGSVQFDAALLKADWNAKFGFDQPLHIQYINYWSDVRKGRPRQVARELPAAGHRQDRVGHPMDGRPARRVARSSPSSSGRSRAPSSRGRKSPRVVGIPRTALPAAVARSRTTCWRSS